MNYFKLKKEIIVFVFLNLRNIFFFFKYFDYFYFRIDERFFISNKIFKVFFDHLMNLDQEFIFSVGLEKVIHVLLDNSSFIKKVNQRFHIKIFFLVRDSFIKDKGTKKFRVTFLAQITFNSFGRILFFPTLKICQLS